MTNDPHQFSDSDDGITSGPFPTLSFDEHSNNSQYVQQQQQQQMAPMQQQSNPNLGIPQVNHSHFFSL